MAVPQGFLDYVIEQLGQSVRLSHKKMFGGVGFYADEIFFGILDGAQLYFKVNETTRPGFEARGMEPFRPYGDERSMNYYQVPADVLEDVDELAVWVREAVEVGKTSKPSRSKRGKR